MNLQAYQDFLAKLYTDPKFRESFVDSPQRIGMQFGLNSDQIGELSGANFEELEYFSKTLFRKRLREVEKLLPLTTALAGNRFETLFREFSAEFTPVSAKKHVEDALGFLAFLASRQDSASFFDAVRFERTRLSFLGSARNVAFCRIGTGIADLLRRSNGTGESRRRPRLAVWLRTGKNIRHYII